MRWLPVEETRRHAVEELDDVAVANRSRGRVHHQLLSDTDQTPPHQHSGARVNTNVIGSLLRSGSDLMLIFTGSKKEFYLYS